ncbi:Solute carrier family 12 member 7 [Frankliniella fusca]|uniref:Solute carrier family 12 member 7 n=1 Tax=Frankliniella fusca TaxID=407009 RepID=A0AAE1H062_9NEOP|nr:Solute carrier family 12 member 7 [Frankliniella fusca]KAK3928195.1 Solute carrier family 12 member 7 [Frankliniella fusca]
MFDTVAGRCRCGCWSMEWRGLLTTGENHIFITLSSFGALADTHHIVRRCNEISKGPAVSDVIFLFSVWLISWSLEAAEALITCSGTGSVPVVNTSPNHQEIYANFSGY